MLAAADLVEVAQAEAKAATEDRDAAEKAALLRTLGAEDGARLPPTLRAQVRQLEDEQKRRATRAQRDVLDRALLDLLSLYRDVLVRPARRRRRTDQRRARGPGAAARRGSPPPSRPCAGWTRSVRPAPGWPGNVAPLLAIEAMAVALRPQG